MHSFVDEVLRKTSVYETAGAAAETNQSKPHPIIVSLTSERGHLLAARSVCDFDQQAMIE